MPNSLIWDFWADKYDRLWVQKYSLGPSRRAVINALAPMLEAGRSYRLLDMGCGTGQLLRELQRAFASDNIEYTGVDISAKMIEQCRRQDSESIYFVADISAFEPAEEAYDFIICSHSFPYYPDKQAAMEKFHHMLKKDGILLMVQASANSLYDSIAMFLVKFTTGKARYLSIKGIMELARCRFDKINIVKIRERFYMPTICLFLFRKGGGL